MFWTLVALLIALAIGLLTFRLWRKPAPAAPDETVDALNVLRDQRAELDREVAAGRLTAEERETRIAELARRVHEEGLDTAAAPAAPVVPPRRRMVVAIATALLVPAVAVPIYLHVGTPAALDPALRTAASPHGEFSPQQIKALIAKIEAKLEQKPDDVTGWVMLGRGRTMVEDFKGASAAYEKANALNPNDPNILADYADVLAMAQGKQLAGKPTELIMQALKLDPKLPKALALAASAAMDAGNMSAAKGYWQRLLELVPPDSEDASEIKRTIAGIDGVSLPPAGSPSAAMAQAAPGAGAAKGGPAAAPAAQKAPPAGDKPITGTIKLDPALAAKVGPEDTVYIFARQENSRMPLAVLRWKASELPKQYTLDDSQTMGGAPLSSFPQLLVEARLSKSGDVSLKPGDMRGLSRPVAPGSRNVDVTIGEVMTAATVPPPPNMGATGMPPGGGAPAMSGAPAMGGAPFARGGPAAGAAPAAAGSGKAVTGTVKVSPALAGKYGPDDTLFIYARPAEGSRMPLAILRLKASELPKTFRLDDSMAMAGGAGISSVPQVRIEARISKSGQAQAAPGDLRGESAPVAPGANVDLVIDKVN